MDVESWWITDEKTSDKLGQTTFLRVQAALSAGRAERCGVIWRRKDLLERTPQPADISELTKIRGLCRAANIPLLVHSFVELARDIGADGVHLSSDVDVDFARRRLGDEAIIGQSLHAGDEVRAVPFLSYVTLSPIFQPASKPDDRRPTIDVGGLEKWCAQVELPTYGLGGVTTADRHRACIAAGAAGTAQLSTWLTP